MKNINFKIIFNLIGMLMLINSLFMLLCVPVALYFGEKQYLNFLISSGITASLGAAIFFGTRNASKKVGKREGYLIVGVGWIMLVISGMTPYAMAYPFLDAQHLMGNEWNFTNYFFETVSGYTTTGSTIFNDIEILPKSLLFWRSMTHWIGGMGIIVLTIAILPILGIGGMQLFVAEASGIETNKIHPRITETAKKLWMVYVFITIVHACFLYGFGMGLFDAVNHAMSTIATGGFSTKNASTSTWNQNPGIQYTLIVFMFLAGTNFVMVYHLLKGKLKKVYENEEFRWYFYFIIGVTILLSTMVYFYADPLQNSIPNGGVENGNYTWENSFRYTLFQVLSIVTSTGYYSADHTAWTPFVSMVFFSLLFVGACAGSTSGGVKIVRHGILLKNSWFELKRLLHPNAVIPIRYNKRAVSQTILYNILAFFVMYMFIWIASSVVMAFINEGVNPGYEEFISAMSITAASLGNIGPGFGHYGPVHNVADLTDSAKWFCSFLMILGRLELFTILILFTPFMWRNN